MSHIFYLYTNDGNLLFNGAVGSHHSNNDYTIYDTDSGKWYRTFFDLEQSFYASNFYSAPSIDDIPKYEDHFPKIDPVKMCFTPTPVNIIGQMSYIIPTLTQRLDGTWATSYGNSPIPIFDTEF